MDTSEKIIATLLTELDAGASEVMLTKKFPEQSTLIQEIVHTRQLLIRAAKAIPEPVINPQIHRLSKEEEPIKSPFFINSLIVSMNYKIVLPILVLGIVVASGSIFISNKSTKSDSVAEHQDVTVPATTQTQTEESYTHSEDANPSDTETTPAPAPTGNTSVATNGGVDDVLSDFSADIASEQSASADDGISADMFAQSDLSDFDSDTYDF